MNDIYIADDGTIRSRNTTSASSANSSASASYQTYHSDISSYEVSTGRKVWFWVYSIVSALVVTAILSTICSTLDLGDGAFLEFFETILPFGLAGGALLGAILYGCNGADNLSYNLGAFILSFLCAIAGAVGIGLVVCIVPFVLIGIWYLFLTALVIGVVVGIFSGGD